MKLPIYQVDAFTSEVFHGNPAAVCPLESWLPDTVLQAIAAENNLSETAFFVRREHEYDLRWFTPACEVELCGHATLASAFVITTILDPGAPQIVFHSRSGRLSVTVEPVSRELRMDFPADAPREVATPPELEKILGIAVEQCLTSRIGYLLAVTDETAVRGVHPDMSRLAALDCKGVIVSAPGSDCDFISRFFAPQLGVPEDPVTGSAHCVLTPFWSERLGKSTLHARQTSARGGELRCERHGARVTLVGHAALYLQGTAEIAG